MADLLFNCWCLEVPSGDSIRHVPGCLQSCAMVPTGPLPENGYMSSLRDVSFPVSGVADDGQCQESRDSENFNSLPISPFLSGTQRAEGAACTCNK
jgi:hypothetical protein